MLILNSEFEQISNKPVCHPTKARASKIEINFLNLKSLFPAFAGQAGLFDILSETNTTSIRQGIVVIEMDSRFHGNDTQCASNLVIRDSCTEHT